MMKQKKNPTKKQYKILAIVWMLAAAAMAAAFVRRIAEFNVFLLLMLVLSLVLATGFWKSYKSAPEEGGANHKSTDHKLEEKNHE